MILLCFFFYKFNLIFFLFFYRGVPVNDIYANTRSRLHRSARFSAENFVSTFHFSPLFLFAFDLFLSWSLFRRERERERDDKAHHGEVNFA